MYTYNNLLDDISFFDRAYGTDEICTGAIGSSFLGRLIPYVHVGKKSGNQIIVTGAIHAREHITAHIVINQAFYAAKNQIKNGGIYFIPMLNPDGNMLVSCGVESVCKSYRNTILNLNGGKNDFLLYKANARGVDLNTNFDARWGTGKQNVFRAGSENYVGEKPFSEMETCAIRDFTHLVKPAATVSYHALGQELYYEFGQDADKKARDYKIASYLNGFLNYKIVGDNFTSSGGYKDWCIEKLGIPSLTIEVVNEKYSHPIMDYENGDEDLKKNIDLPIKLLEYITL